MNEAPVPLSESASRHEDDLPASLRRRILFAAALVSSLSPVLSSAQSGPAPAQGDAERLNELGPEMKTLVPRVGLWDVTETVWMKPGARGEISTGLVAERRMIGSMYQEFIRPAADTASQEIKRIDYLTFHRVESRWEYVSMDLRAPVGIMSAYSQERGENGRIDIAFTPFAIAGPFANATGQMVRMTQTIDLTGPDDDRKDQYFTLADGVGTKWLAHRYAYRRRP